MMNQSIRSLKDEEKTTETIQTAKSVIIVDVEHRTVTKKFSSAQAFHNELEVYRFQPAFAPKLIDHDNHKNLIIEYISDVTLIDCTDSGRDFRAIAELHKAIHALKTDGQKVLCHIDVNPRNYLCRDNRWYMIDFSDCRMDLPQVDTIHFLLHLASNYPQEVFRQAARDYLQTFSPDSFDKTCWHRLLQSWIRRFDRRRFAYRQIEPTREAWINRDWLDFKNREDYLTKIFPDPSPFA